MLSCLHSEFLECRRIWFAEIVHERLQLEWRWNCATAVTNPHTAYTLHLNISAYECGYKYLNIDYFCLEYSKLDWSPKSLSYSKLNLRVNPLFPSPETLAVAYHKIHTTRKNSNKHNLTVICAAYKQMNDAAMRHILKASNYVYPTGRAASY